MALVEHMVIKTILGGAHPYIEPKWPIMALYHPKHITVQREITQPFENISYGRLWLFGVTWSSRPFERSPPIYRAEYGRIWHPKHITVRGNISQQNEKLFYLDHCDPY